MLSNDRLNLVYLVLLYGALGLGGSAFSVLVIGAVIFSSVKLVIGRLPDGRQLLIGSFAIAGVGYYASGLLMIATHPADAGNYPLAVERLLFVGILPLFLQIALLDKDRLIDALEVGAAVGAAGVAGWAAWEWSAYTAQFSDFRVSGAPGNPGPYGTSCGILLAICMIGAIRSTTVHRRVVLFSGAVLSSFGLMLSGMRTIYPLLLIIPIIGYYYFGYNSIAIRSRYRIFLVVISFLLITLGGFVALSRVTLLLSMVGESGLEPSATNSLGQRIALLICAQEGFLTAPLLGMGRDGAYAFMAHCTQNLIGEPLMFSHFHNALATAAVFGGLVEISATVALLLVPLYWCWRYRRNPEARYGVVLILSTLSIYGLNGAANLMLGHDIHDALFVHIMTVGFVLLAGGKVAQGAAKSKASASDEAGRCATAETGRGRVS
ncbi:MAG: O-antigen ligase family protein [Roseitalea sp.]|jgi:O-antigen ligase|nr:O-antigen ligase family protein [Roseitalea sp.]MBO6722753.1 O-antigen ligase family protein [Roseitalea sp.]MBO6745173.1 O-antigen ligase family protein [Roseitalea sp.]